MSARPTRVFLTAEWRWLAMLNYEIAPDLLAPFVPAGTELDFHQGRLLASVVGFLFQKARVCGISIPFHRNFEEVNLRFYVRRKVNGDWRRGVVFIRELVPRAAIAWAARTFYNENYTAMPMSHHIEKSSDISEGIKSVAYHWRFGGQDQYVKMTVRGQPVPIRGGTEQEFITEHFWGYASQRNGATIEYQVEHPRWRVWETESASLHCDVPGLYGEKFCGPLSSPPASAFLAEGSAVKVFKGVRLNPRGNEGE